MVLNDPASNWNNGARGECIAKVRNFTCGGKEDNTQLWGMEGGREGTDGEEVQRR